MTINVCLVFGMSLNIIKKMTENEFKWPTSMVTIQWRCKL